ncbi:MAG: hypothetical protein QG625_872 [Cyanobacteriota bacterium erpe_2018_sw_39hr_WHONDRS-SW48-000098_B_bin.30]|nr:hypothetical protein [Candidatus Obscuribacter sp.]MBK9205658.1 hypothetical protein [Candidatus Obscuribacter sp.]MDQ5964718.1 hypothetical protein [Cyanobacteriota bacterium erpe_2018_sw_39hr_WHONDRS-SW48-000098_B_bin.30]
MPGDVPEISRQDADRLVNSPREKQVVCNLLDAAGVDKEARAGVMNKLVELTRENVKADEAAGKDVSDKRFYEMGFPQSQDVLELSNSQGGGAGHDVVNETYTKPDASGKAKLQSSSCDSDKVS